MDQQPAWLLGALALVTAVGGIFLNYRRQADAGALDMLKVKAADNGDKLVEAMATLKQMQAELADCRVKHQAAELRAARWETELAVMRRIQVNDLDMTKALTIQQALHGEQLAEVKKQINGGSQP